MQLALLCGVALIAQAAGQWLGARAGPARTNANLGADAGRFPQGAVRWTVANAGSAAPLLESKDGRLLFACRTPSSSGGVVWTVTGSSSYPCKASALTAAQDILVLTTSSTVEAYRTQSGAQAWRVTPLR